MTVIIIGLVMMVTKVENIMERYFEVWLASRRLK